MSHTDRFSQARNTVSRANSTTSQASSASSQQSVGMDDEGVQSQADRASPHAARASSPQAGTPIRSSRHSLPQRGENTLEDLKLKWVINLSSKPLTQMQRSLLAKGSNFAVTPRHPPNLEYITYIE